MSDNPYQALNQLLDMLNFNAYGQPDRKTRGSGMVGTTADFLGNHRDAAESAQRVKGEDGVRFLDAADKKVADAKRNISKAAEISGRFEAEAAQAQQAAKSAMKETLLDKVYDDAKDVQDRFEAMAESENLADDLIKHANDYNSNAGLFKNKINVEAFVEDLKAIRSNLEKDHKITIDCPPISLGTIDEIEDTALSSPGGERIYLREVMQTYPEVFGQVKGKVGILGRANQERIDALDELEYYDPTEILEAEQAYGFALHKSEYAKEKLERLQEKTKDLSDQVDMERLDQFDTFVDAPIEAEEELEMPDVEVDTVDLEKEAEIAAAAARGSRVEVDTMPIEAAEVEQDDILDLTEDMMEEREVEEVKAAEKVQLDQADALQVEEGVSKESLQEVVSANQAYANSVLEQLKTDPQMTAEKAKAELDRLVNAAEKGQGKIREEIQDVYLEVQDRIAFEAKQPQTAEEQRAILLDREKKHFAANNRGSYTDVEVDGVKVKVRSEVVGEVNEYNERVAAERESGESQKKNVSTNELRGREEKNEVAEKGLARLGMTD